MHGSFNEARQLPYCSSSELILLWITSYNDNCMFSKTDSLEEFDTCISLSYLSLTSAAPEEPPNLIVPDSTVLNKVLYM